MGEVGEATTGEKCCMPPSHTAGSEPADLSEGARWRPNVKSIRVWSPARSALLLSTPRLPASAMIFARPNGLIRVDKRKTLQYIMMHSNSHTPKFASRFPHDAEGPPPKKENTSQPKDLHVYHNWPSTEVSKTWRPPLKNVIHPVSCSH